MAVSNPFQYQTGLAKFRQGRFIALNIAYLQASSHKQMSYSSTQF